MEFLRNEEYCTTMTDAEKEEPLAITYPVDTVLRSGEVQTDHVPCYGAFSWGKQDDRKAFYESAFPQIKKPPLIVGLGVTEAGLSQAETTVMKDLFQLFEAMEERFYNGEWALEKTSKICVIDMDNVPNNGRVLQKHMATLTTSSPKAQRMQAFFDRHVSFHDTMVDRITSQREGSDGMIPRCEPVPAKALVILDQHQALPKAFLNVHSNEKPSSYGVVIRTKPEQLQADINLKLRVANGTHTAIAHLLALTGHTMTDYLSSSDEDANLFRRYLDQLFEHQILKAGVLSDSDSHSYLVEPNSPETRAVYQDWRDRLTHPHFGLSSFFITQNGAAKGGIRLGPTVRDLVKAAPGEEDITCPVTLSTAFAFSVLLRWLTPTNSGDSVFSGKLDLPIESPNKKAKTDAKDKEVEYADKLRYDLERSWYEFRCSCLVDDSGTKRNLSEWLGSLASASASSSGASFLAPVKAYLVAPDGGNLSDIVTSPSFDTFVQTVAWLYARSEKSSLALLRMIDINGKGFATACSSIDRLENLFNGSQTAAFDE